MRVNITLECTSCHERTYLTSKNRRHNPDRLELKKYCPRERKVTLHRETKWSYLVHQTSKLLLSIYWFFLYAELRPKKINLRSGQKL